MKVKLTLKIEESGSAFDYPHATDELCRILRDAAHTIHNHNGATGVEETVFLRDYNGNTCGHFKLKMSLDKDERKELRERGEL